MATTSCRSKYQPQTVQVADPGPPQRVLPTVRVLDAGMTELIRPALYGAFHRIALVDPRPGAAEVLCDVVGPVCESSDTFGRDRALADPGVGDLVALLDAGAYGAVMASNYNTRPRPPEVMVDQGRWWVSRPRERLDELFRTERVMP